MTMLQLHDHDNTRCQPVEQKPDRADVPKTYPKGRRCIHEDAIGVRCITLLNQYNVGPLCLHHAAQYEAQIARLLGDV